MVCGITAYGESLRGALGCFADMLEPIPAALPAERHTWDLRSDREAGVDELTLEALLPRTQGTCTANLPLLPTPGHKVSLPGTKPARITVLPNTVCNVTVTMSDGERPRAKVAFSRGLVVHNAMEFAGFRYLSPTCNYNLESITMNSDGAIDIDGSVRVMHMFNKQYNRRVKRPTTSVQNHWAMGLLKGAAQTIFTTVPSFVLKPLSLFVPTADERIGDWASMLESVAPLVEIGRLSWKGTFNISKPAVVRLDSADVILPQQVCDTSFIADILPGPHKVSLVTHPGTQWRSKSGDMDVSGTISVSPTEISGKDVRASVKTLRADVLLSNGHKDQVLVPLTIDAHHDTEPVAEGAVSFVFGKQTHFDGRVDFALPARVVDENRHIHGDSADVTIDKVALDVMLRGHAMRGPVSRDAQVNFDVPRLQVQGKMVLKPDVAARFKTVPTLPIDINLQAHPRPPLTIEAQYSAADQEPARGGAALGFDLLYPVAEKDLLRIDGAAGHALVDRVLLAAQGGVRFGSMAHDARRRMEGEFTAYATHVGARIFLDPITLDTLHLGEGTVLETLPSPEDKPAVSLTCTVEQLPCKEPQVHGHGRADIPVKLDTLGPMELLFSFGRGPAKIVEATARLCMKPLRVHWSPSSYGASGDFSMRYEARTKVHLKKPGFTLFGSP